MVTPNAGAIGRSEEHRKSNRRAPTHVEGRHFFGRICPCVQTTELRTTDNPSATAVTPDPNPSSNQLSVAGYSRTYCLECCPHRTTYGSQVERTASKTHVLSEVLPNIIPSRCAIKEGQQPSHHTTTLNPFPYISMCGYIVTTIPVVGESGSFPGRIFNGTRTP